MPRRRVRPKQRTAVFTEHGLLWSADMLTLDADHAFWESTVNAPIVECSFVRIYPPAGLTPEQIATAKAWLLEKGKASAVKVMPQPTEAVPDALEATTAAPSRPIRQVVFDRAARTPGVRCHGALADLLTGCMDKAGI